jgi:LemA protein
MEWIVLGVIVVLLLWLVVIYNRLVSLRQTVGQSWSDIEVQLKQRHDLIPNLVETVKGYARHESGTLEAVIKARNNAVAAQGPQAASAAEGQLSGALSRLFALSEAYPDLKANTNFLSLQGELSTLETKIAAARRFFNNAVSEFNSSIQSVPAVFFAGALGFKERGFFELEANERAAVQTAPQVKF